MERKKGGPICARSWKEKTGLQEGERETRMPMMGGGKTEKGEKGEWGTILPFVGKRGNPLGYFGRKEKRGKRLPKKEGEAVEMQKKREECACRVSQKSKMGKGKRTSLTPKHKSREGKKPIAKKRKRERKIRSPTPHQKEGRRGGKRKKLRPGGKGTKNEILERGPETFKKGKTRLFGLKNGEGKTCLGSTWEGGKPILLFFRGGGIKCRHGEERLEQRNESPKKGGGGGGGRDGRGTELFA